MCPWCSTQQYLSPRNSPKSPRNSAVAVFEEIRKVPVPETVLSCTSPKKCPVVVPTSSVALASMVKLPINLLFVRTLTLFPLCIITGLFSWVTQLQVVFLQHHGSSSQIVPDPQQPYCNRLLQRQSLFVSPAVKCPRGSGTSRNRISFVKLVIRLTSLKKVQLTGK